MPRTSPHPLDRIACYSDNEVEMCNRVAQAVAKASTSTNISDQRAVIRESVHVCRKFAAENKRQIRLGILKMQINHRGRIKALKKSLETAGVKRLDASAHTILVVGYFLHYLPNLAELPSATQEWENVPEVSWLHWVELAPICRCDIAEYPAPYIFTYPETLPPEGLFFEPLVDPDFDKNCWPLDEFLGAISENYRRFDHCLKSIVSNSLTPRQVRLQRDQLINELND